VVPCIPCGNCPDDYNPDQVDTNGDEIGDVCDGCCVDRVCDANGLGGDEPTLRLSPGWVIRIYNVIRNYRSCSVTSLLIVEHRLSEVLSLADRVCGMESGRIKSVKDADLIERGCDELKDLYFRWQRHRLPSAPLLGECWMQTWENLTCQVVEFGIQKRVYIIIARDHIGQYIA
jgi:hypothetical protein